MSTPTRLEKLHAGPRPYCLALTGGGTAALGQLLSVAGGSRNLLEAIVPYSHQALADCLRRVPEQACSAFTARALAMAAFRRAQDLARRQARESAPVAGVGCTASLAALVPKRGPHRIWVAWQTEEATGELGLNLEKNARNRAEEENLAAEIVISALCAVEQVADRPQLPLRPGEHLHCRELTAPPAWRALLLGQRVWARAAGPPLPPTVRPVLFPGSFHPLHAGHRKMAQLAAARLPHPLVYELSIENVDKLPLDYLEIQDRLSQFAADDCVWLSRCPRFTEKLQIQSPAAFVVGTDTVARLADAAYYGHSPEARDGAIAQFRQAGCRFLVFGRRGPQGFQSLESLQLPAGLSEICQGVSEHEFRDDTTSTALRLAAGSPDEPAAG